jgi:hypothetical protein
MGFSSTADVGEIPDLKNYHLPLDEAKELCSLMDEELGGLMVGFLERDSGA